MFTKDDFLNYLKQIKKVKEDLHKTANELDSKITDKKMKAELLKIKQAQSKEAEKSQSVLDKIAKK